MGSNVIAAKSVAQHQRVGAALWESPLPLAVSGVWVAGALMTLRCENPNRRRRRLKPPHLRLLAIYAFFPSS